MRVSVSNDEITTLISLDDMLLISETSIRDPVFKLILDCLFIQLIF